MSIESSISHATLLEARILVPAHVVFRQFPSETVALNLKTGQYHGLNPTAGAMLEALGELQSIDKAAARVAAEFGQPLPRVRDDLLVLCAQLAQRELLEILDLLD